MSIVLPDTVEVPKHIAEALSKDCDYYKVEDLPISNLVEKPFIEKFVKAGGLTLLSIDTKIDLDDCVCVTPEGLLVLSLTKDTYESLGVEGQLSHFCKNNKERYRK